MVFDIRFQFYTLRTLHLTFYNDFISFGRTDLRGGICSVLITKNEYYYFNKK